MKLTKEQREELDLLSQPVMKFLKDNFDPHTSVVIESCYTSILQDLAGFPYKEVANESLS